MWRQDDLSIFRLKPGSKRPRSSIPLESICQSTLQDYSIHRTVWTAGYNGGDEKAQRSEIPVKIRLQNTTPSNPHPTAFDSLLHYSHTQAEQVYGGPILMSITEFPVFFEPNSRAMATGQVIGAANPTYQGVMK